MQLKNHTVEVLEKDDVNIILDMSYANDSLYSLSENIEVHLYVCFNKFTH